MIYVIYIIIAATCIMYIRFFEASKIGLKAIKKKPKMTDIKKRGNLYTLFQKLFILFK